MIPRRYFQKDLRTLMDIVLYDRRTFSLDEFIGALIVAALDLNQGNRVQTARQLRIPIKAFREKLKVIEGLGYEIPPNICRRVKSQCRKGA